MAASVENSSMSASGPGLRSRKKARRREEILSQARILFAHKGIQATTVAEIAEAVDVSPPTVFNYFGNKDGILIALITEGSTRSRAARLASMAREDGEFADITCDMLCEISRATLGIADKRIWRYAEAAAIRHPTTELAQEYLANDDRLRASIRTFLDQYDLQFRSAVQMDTGLLAGMIFDLWNAAFFQLIRAESMTLDVHFTRLRQVFIPLCTGLFTDAFLRAPKLKPGKGPE